VSPRRGVGIVEPGDRLRTWLDMERYVGNRSFRVSAGQEVALMGVEKAVEKVVREERDVWYAETIIAEVAFVRE